MLRDFLYETLFCFKKVLKMCYMYFFKYCSKFWVYSNLSEQTYSKNSDSLLKNPIISKQTVPKHFVPTIHFIIIMVIIIIIIIMIIIIIIIILIIIIIKIITKIIIIMDTTFLLTNIYFDICYILSALDICLPDTES